MARETSSRKYQITINNPIEHGFSHEQIIEKINTLTISYWCMCDEIGAEQTPHTHVFIYAKNPIMFSTIQKRFYGAHIESAKGTCQENRDYIRKEGKHLDSDKKETNIIETFKEFGDLPIERRGSNQTISNDVLNMIKDGFDDLEIINKYPSYLTKISHLEKTRQIILENKYKKEFRNINVMYIFGETETGKTRHVLDTFGYENVYKITNYNHPFDDYKSQDVILFDEFRSSLPLKDMLQYLDGYPCRLPSRYVDKQACYTKVFIISNIDLYSQYRSVQESEPASWDAFWRRIDRVFEYTKKDKNISRYDENNIERTEIYK